MTKFNIALSSPAFWSIALVFVVQGLTAILPSLSGSVATIVQLILGILALYLHPSELKTAGQTGMLGSQKI